MDTCLFVNDEDTLLRMYRGIPFPSSRSDECSWISQQSSLSTGEYQFAVENLSGQLVGRCGIGKVIWKDRVAELNIMIGPDFRGNGYGLEALNLVSAFCFEQMGLHRLKVSVMAFNTPALRLYQKCGFRIEGRLREEIWRNGRWEDVVILGKIREA